MCTPPVVAGLTAWRGDAPLLKQLLGAGARLDVQGVSRGEGPYSPLQWAERKVSGYLPAANSTVESMEAVLQ